MEKQQRVGNARTTGREWSRKTTLSLLAAVLLASVLGLVAPSSVSASSEPGRPVTSEPRIGAALPGSRPFTVVEYWDKYEVNDRKGWSTHCLYQVVAVIKEEDTYTKPGSDERYAIVARAQWGPGTYEVPVFTEMGGYNYLSNHYHPTEQLPAGTYGYAWAASTGYDYLAGQNQCGQIEDYKNTGAAAVEAARDLGVYSQAPVVSGEIFRIVNSGGNVLKEGEGADMRIRVQNDGTSPLTNVSIDAITVASTDPEESGHATFEPSTSEGALRLSGVLGTESLESVDFADYRMEGIDVGTVRITAFVSAVNAEGTWIGRRVYYDLTILKTPLEVDVVLDPAALSIEKKLEDQPAEGGTGEPAEPETTSAVVTLTNSDVETLSAVSFPAAVDIFGTDGAVMGITRIRQKGSAQPVEGVGPVDMGPFDLEPGESRAVKYVLDVLSDGQFEVRANVQFYDGENVRFAQGSAELAVGVDKVLGVSLTTELGDDPGQLTGGQMVRLSGSLYNFSSTDTLEVNLASLVADPSANAQVLAYRPLEDDATAGSCYLPTNKVVIGPGERFPIHGLLLTSPDGGTRGSVTFAVPEATRITPEGVRTAVPAGEKTLSPAAASASSEPLSFSYRVDTSVEMISAWNEAEWKTFGGYFTHGAVIGGVEWLANNIEAVHELITMASSWENLAAGADWLAVHVLQTAEVYYNSWLFASPSEKLEFAADVGQMVYDLSIRAGMNVLDADVQRKAAEAVLPGWFDQIENAYATNDPQAMGAAFGRVTGNVGLEVVSCVLPSAKWKGKFAKLAEADTVAATAALETAARKAKAGSADAIKQMQRAGIKNGAKVGQKSASTLWGTGSAAYVRLANFASDNKLLIHVRERSAGSIKRLKQGFIEKMEHMKLKNMRSDIDVPLGYLDEHVDTVVFKKPISQAEADSVFRSIADPDLRKEIQQRYAKRVEEYAEWKPMYDSWVKNGFPSSFEYGPNLATGVKGRTRLPFRLKEVKVGGKVVPDYTIPEVFIDGKWRGFTGDIDITDIRFANGRSLNPNQARFVYDQLSKMADVNLRHGDTINWLQGPDPAKLMKIKIGQLKSFFVGAEDKLLQFAPDGVRAVQLDPEKTFITTKAGSRSTYATYDGGYKQGVSVIDFNGQVLEVSRDQARAVPWVAPADWAFGGKNGELAECQPIADASEGYIIRQEVEGALLEVFLDGRWQTFDTEACRSTSGSLPMLRASLRPMPKAGAARVDATKTRLRFKPQSGLATLAEAGTNEVDIHDLPLGFGDEYVGDWFQVGDTIMLEPGTERQEEHVITGISPLVTATPLKFSHDPNSMVTVFSRPAAPDNPETPETPETPTTPTAPNESANPPGSTGPTVPGVGSNEAVLPAPGGGTSRTQSTAGSEATDGLPTTGSQPGPATMIALALVAAGFAMTRIGRRRHRRAS